MRDRRHPVSDANDPEPQATWAVSWIPAILGKIWAWALNALSMTWRVRLEGVDELDDYLDDERPLILVFWHGHYLMLYPALRCRRVCVFTSLSRRGRILGSLARSLGMTTAMIPDHGGETSYRIMKNRLSDGVACAIAVDGPLGPYHRVKTGAVRLASELNVEVFAAAAASRKSLKVRSRWDQLEIPLPFTAVGLAVAPPFGVPEALSREQLEIWTGRVHQCLDDVYAKAEKLAD
jgi:lysophospholipid acyltransferase (LPLAT)-like uncharacterized protein